MTLLKELDALKAKATFITEDSLPEYNKREEVISKLDAITLIHAFADKLEGEEMVEKCALAAANCRRSLFHEKPMTLKQLKRDSSWKDWLNEAKAALAVVREEIGG
jgi:hypothetical protein